MRDLRATLPAAALTLCGCSGLLHSSAPALQLYVLQPPPAAAGAPQSVTAAAPTLRLARPLPGPGLNTDRIALLRPGNRLDFYADSRWSGPLSEVVADLQLAVLRADPTWGAVTDDRGTLNADYLLQMSIDRFTADYAAQAGPPLVRVDLHCLLTRRSDGAVLGSFTVSESEIAAQNRMASVVATFSQVADEAVLAVAAQVDQQISSAKPPAVP